MPPPDVKCPTCGRRLEWNPANPWRPFCSERCRLIDLGAWIREERRIPGETAPLDPDEPDEPDNDHPH